jgi:hypothetical protein
LNTSTVDCVAVAVTVGSKASDALCNGSNNFHNQIHNAFAQLLVKNNNATDTVLAQSRVVE